MTTKLKRLITAIILIVFITVSSFVLPQNINKFIQKSDTIASEIEASTENNNEGDNLEQKEDPKNFTMMSLNIVYHLFYKYLHNKDFNK